MTMLLARSTPTLTMLETFSSVRALLLSHFISINKVTLANNVVSTAGCFSENVDSETGEISLAPRIVLDAKADRVWHFQTFEALATVPEEQFLVPEICTEDPEPEPLPAF